MESTLIDRCENCNYTKECHLLKFGECPEYIQYDSKNHLIGFCNLCGSGAYLEQSIGKICNQNNEYECHGKVIGVPDSTWDSLTNLKEDSDFIKKAKLVSSKVLVCTYSNISKDTLILSIDDFIEYYSNQFDYSLFYYKDIVDHLKSLKYNIYIVQDEWENIING